MSSFQLFSSCILVIVLSIMCLEVLSFSNNMQRTMGTIKINRNVPSTISQTHKTFQGMNNFAMMASRGGGQGSTKIDKKTDIDTKTKPTYREEIEKDWRLILHDDTVHTIQQVCEILGTCCPLCSGPRAYEVTLEVHMTGAGTVAVANKKIVDEYCKSLQMAGLSVSMAPDDDFEADEDME